MNKLLRFSTMAAILASSGVMAMAGGTYTRSAGSVSGADKISGGVYVTNPITADYFSAGRSGSRRASAPSVQGVQIYYAYPETSDFNKYVVIDNNNDGFTWEAPGLYGMSYSGGLAKLDADDWCILPAVTLDDPSVFYDFFCEARGALDANPEDFDVYIGTSPTIAGMTTKILEVRDLDYKRNMNIYDEFEKFFTIPAAGTYYIGFHAISPGTSCAFYVRNIYLTKTTIKASSPEQVSDVSAQPDNKGGLSATVSFTLPTKDNNGNTYGSSAQITATVKSPVQTKTVTGAPGSRQSVVVNTVEGENAITITTSVDGNAGLVYTTYVNCGLDIPGQPLNITSTVREDNMALIINWDAPTEGANGGFMNPDDTYYFLYKYSEDTETWTYLDYTYSTDYTVTVKPTDPQQNMIIGVAAVNSKDEETPEKLYAVTSGVIGRPYATPFIEEFRIGATPYQPVVKDVPSAEYDTYLWFGNPSEGLGGYADLPGRKCYIAFSRQTGHKSYSRTLLPKISTQNITEGQASFYIYINYETPKTEFYITDNSGVETLLGTIDKNSAEDGWNTFTYDIPSQYIGQRWVNFIIKAEYDNGWGQFMTLAGYELTAQVDHDLAIESVKGDAAITSEETGSYVAVVENRGREPETLQIKAEVYDANETLLATLQRHEASDAPSLAPRQKGSYIFQYAPTDAHVGAVTLRVTILNEDERADNNVYDFAINVSKANRPEADDFSLDNSTGDITLTWSTPVIHFHDSFEDYEPYSYPDYIGLLLNYDEDMKSTYTLNGLNFPGSEAAKAWQVFSVSDSGIVGSNYKAPHGDQYVWAFCPADGTAASDWLLSPRIKGGSIVSFKANIVGDFDEMLDVVYAVKEQPSLTDFRILDSLTLRTFGWEEYEYRLPANATFWGLHYISADAFGVMVDEYDYKVDYPREYTGFNVYRNGVKIASNLNGFSYTDTESKEGDGYYVTVSYTNASGVAMEGWPTETLYNGVPAGVDSAVANAILKIEYTTPSGVRVDNPDRGIFIRTVYYTDGKVKIDKIVK